MKNVLLTIILTLLVLILAVLVYMWSGTFDPSQMARHKPVSMWIIGTTMRHSFEKRMKGIKAPALNDSAMFAQGFMHYNEMCVVCHGAPGIEPSELAKGLYPEPPRFYKSEDMPHPEESFWIIKNGIRMTSMPAFGSTHTDKNIWDITAFMLNKMNSMTPSDYQEWIKKYGDHEMDAK
jgi:mono/diheme cytochrome c family protein